MRCAGGPREPANRTARTSFPVRCAQARKGRHQINACIVGQVSGKTLTLGGVLDQTKLIAQPLNNGAGIEDGAFKRISRAATGNAVAQRAQQPVRRCRACIARIGDQKGAGAIGDLGGAGR